MSSSFQQALYRNVTEKNAQLEKRLENVIREGMPMALTGGFASDCDLANGEISLLTNKMGGACDVGQCDQATFIFKTWHRTRAGPGGREAQGGQLARIPQREREGVSQTEGTFYRSHHTMKLTPASGAVRQAETQSAPGRNWWEQRRPYPAGKSDPERL